MFDEQIDQIRAVLADRHRSICGTAHLAGKSRHAATLAAQVGPADHYGVMPSSFCRAVEALPCAAGSGSPRRQLFGVLLGASLNLLDSPSFGALPSRSRRHHLGQLKRIASLEDPEADWLSLSSDIFHKELGLATLRLHAAAAQLIDPRCGIPRSILVRQPPRHWWSTSSLFLRMGGFSPLFQIHTHLSYLDEFNAEGWKECYRTCADLATIYPAVRGMFGASWFYDPAIEEISPRLAYLRQDPMSGGAACLLYAEEGHFVQDAISTSPTRRQLHEAGQYHPRSFMLVWTRGDLLSWARANS